METVRCPHCGKENALNGAKGRRSFHMDCIKCLKGFQFEFVFIRGEKQKFPIPHFDIGEQVYIVNKDHELNLEPAIIVQKDYTYCRVKVRRGREKILIWVPVFWLQRSF
jgi:hypothetical protein